MYSKLAFRNLRKSIKDYTIYFLTLVFGVCIFYTFNSIQSQSIMMELSDMQANAFDLVDKVMGVTSIFISFILGFLIIYANNYLIRRRKKEFGIYMILGMEKRNLSTIIFIETFIIGLLSLGIGLVIGVLLSQGLSIFTAKLFQVNLIKFQFVFSFSAFVKTILCFGVIYFVVLLFNSFTINKVKLIELLTASKKNEKLKIKNIWLSVILFVISIGMIGYAYYLNLKNGIATLSMNINGVSILLGVIGTFIFFFSLTGFLLTLVQRNKKYYLKDLNAFVLRQINSKINTTFISMSFICLMLFLAICMFSGGIGINRALNADIKELTQFDMTFWNNKGEDIEKVLEERGVKIGDYAADYVHYTSYESGVSYHDFFTKEGIEKGKSYFPIITNADVSVMRLSEFNHVMRMLNKEEVKLEKNTYMAFGDIKDVLTSIEQPLKANKKITINGVELTPAQTNVIEVVTYNQMMKSNMCTLVVDDSLVTGLKPINSFLNVRYNGDGETIEKAIASKIRGTYEMPDMQTYYMSKSEFIANSAGLGAIASYLGIYIGIIFLITSASVLALQQLSESTENVERYKLLKQIGVDETIIHKSLFTQVAIYFMMPLSLALVHSVVGLKVASSIVSIFGTSDAMKNIIMTAIVLVIVYGGYFIATYIGAKKNISQQ